MGTHFKNISISLSLTCVFVINKLSSITQKKEDFPKFYLESRPWHPADSFQLSTLSPCPARVLKVTKAFLESPGPFSWGGVVESQEKLRYF